MSKFKIIGFHGTDECVANDILRDGFQCKENKEHWLGNGIYLYADKELAKWWTTNPTQKHGIKIKNPVIIECLIECDEDRVLNLCSLEGYQKYVDLYNSFFREWAYRSKSYEELNFKQLRCAFFNYLFLLYKVDIVIAPFVLPDQPYMPQYFNTQFANAMNILYTEIQMCISETKQNIIIDKSIHSL